MSNWFISLRILVRKEDGCFATFFPKPNTNCVDNMRWKTDQSGHKRSKEIIYRELATLHHLQFRNVSPQKNERKMKIRMRKPILRMRIFKKIN